MLFSLVSIVCATAQLDILRDRLSPFRVRHHMMKLQKPRLRAPAIRPHKRTSSLVARPCLPLYRCWDVSRAARWRMAGTWARNISQFRLG